jgi:hypothetical protein
MYNVDWENELKFRKLKNAPPLPLNDRGISDYATGSDKN